MRQLNNDERVHFGTAPIRRPKRTKKKNQIKNYVADCNANARRVIYG